MKRSHVHNIFTVILEDYKTGTICIEWVGCPVIQTNNNPYLRLLKIIKNDQRLDGTPQFLTGSGKRDAVEESKYF